jgi:DNA-binding NtrC family response regulator
MKVRILIIDDDLDLCREISGFLGKHNFEVRYVNSLGDSHQVLEKYHPEIILLDLKLPNGTGLEFLVELREKYPDIMILMLSGYGTISVAVDAIKRGATNFLTKPIDPDYLLFTLNQIIEQKQLRNRLVAQELELSDRRILIFGNSPKMNDAMQKCLQAAKIDSTVLITGETGTGKQLIAHYLHQNSRRAQFPFVYINCAALSETILESDLFGHEKGSFTGAHRQKKGRVELAHRGTLFLDEFGEMPLSIQSKLLHFIEYGQFQRVGGTLTLQSDVRLIAATNRRPEEEVKNGKFREDLYYRINVININIPPLRERREDIPVLVNHFMEKYGKELGKRGCEISGDTLEKLTHYPWPGNVRELQNAIERALVFCKSRHLTTRDFHIFSQLINTGGPRLFQPRPLKEAVDDFKKEYIRKVLDTTGDSQTKAAKILQIGRTYLNRMIRELQIQ